MTLQLGSQIAAKDARRSSAASSAQAVKQSAPGALVKVTIDKVIRRGAAATTLERIFMTDKRHVKVLRERSKNFTPVQKRRGGRIWTKHPHKLHLKLSIGLSATVRLTTQLRRDLGSVVDFINVAPAPAVERGAVQDDPKNHGAEEILTAWHLAKSGSYAPTWVAPPAVGPGTPVTTAGGSLLERARSSTIARALTRMAMAEANRLRPIFEGLSSSPLRKPIPLEMELPIRDKVLQTLPRAQPKPTELDALISTRRVTDIFLDVSDRLGMRPAELLQAARHLHGMVAALGALAHPVVVGPLARRELELRRKLALHQVRVTEQTFDEYCQSVHNRRALKKRFGGKRGPLPGGPKQRPRQ